MQRSAAVVVFCLAAAGVLTACRSAPTPELQPTAMQQAFDEYAAAHNADRPVVDATVPATEAGVPLQPQTIADIGRRCRRNVATTAVANFSDTDTVTLLRSSPKGDRIVLTLQSRPGTVAPTGPIFEIRVTEPSLIVAADEAWHDAVSNTPGLETQLVRVVGGRSLEMLVRGTPIDMATFVATFQSTLDVSCIARAGEH